MDAHDLRYWIGFNRARGIGPVRLRSVLKQFGTIQAAWNASADQLKASGLDQRSLNSLLSVRATVDLDAELRAVEAIGASIITFMEPQYPPALLAIADAPPLLYFKGTLTEADNRAMAVVGTRRATSYGKMIAGEMTRALVQYGFTIVSGLARGIDAMAHQSALESGGRTIAVLATGIDQVYPAEHRDLADAISRQGTLITELPIGSPPERGHFIPRNRIISGLARGVLVVEAAEKSGALKTADVALDQGREVFAIPGNASSPVSRGTNILIRNGAKMTLDVSDILNEIDGTHLPPQPSVHSTSLSFKPVTRPEISPIERQVLAQLAAEPRHIDEIAYRCRLPVMQVSSALTLLELKGLAQQMGAMQYVFVGEL